MGSLFGNLVDLFKHAFLDKKHVHNLDFAFLAYDNVTADIIDHYSVLKVRTSLRDVSEQFAVYSE